MEITIALTKGRILKETLGVIAQAGITPVEDMELSRKLLFDTNVEGVRLLILRSSDVPTYVRFGAADLGVVGKDTLLEHGTEGLYEPLDLNIACCQLTTAGIIGVSPKIGRFKVATKYVNIARKYYAERGSQVDIIKLYGAMELAPIMKLSDEIVDIVDTGSTLKANGLEVREKISDISSRLIVNKAAMKMKHSGIKEIIDSLEQVVK
jgi:ATP phosphoribosyltransferase